MRPLPPLYLITDRHLVPEGRQLLESIEELLQAGVRMVQLREKDLPAAKLYPLARQLRTLTRCHDCLLLINDRVDLALACEADGVHLGGHSMPLPSVRKLLGPDRLIGISTHSPVELPEAALQGADFATFGPVFFTPSKASFGAPVGLKKLTHACQLSPIPVYGLGGISVANCASVLQTGASGVALISALLGSDAPAVACQELLAILIN